MHFTKHYYLDIVSSFTYTAKEDVERVGMTEEDAEDLLKKIKKKEKK